MKFFKPLVFFFLVATVRCDAQPPKSIEESMAYVVAVSFRMAGDSKLMLDSLMGVAQRSGNRELIDYTSFIQTFWKVQFGSMTDEDRKKQQAKIDEVITASPDIKLRGWAMLIAGGNLAYNTGHPDTGLSLMLRGKKLLEEAGYQQLSYAITYYVAFGNMYLYFEDYKNVLRYFQLALKEPPTYFIGKQSLYNDVGTCYMRLDIYDSATIAFNNAIKVSEEAGLHSYAGMAIGNIGNVLLLQKKYKEAIPYFLTGINQTIQEIPEAAELYRIRTAWCLLQLDSLNKATAFLTPPAIKIPDWTQPVYDQRRFETFALYFQKKGDYKLAAAYKDSLLFLIDRLKKERNNKKIIELESNLSAQQFAEQRKAAETSIKNIRARRNILIGSLVALFGFLLFGLWQRAKKEKLLAEKNEIEARAAMELANQKLDAYLLQLKEKDDMLEKFKTRFDDLQVDDVQKDKIVNELIQTVLLTEDDWKQFKELFDQARPGFLDKLSMDYPNLTPAELRLILLGQLPVSTKQQATVLGISAASVRTSKYRLRKKYPNLLADDPAAEE